jgi:hypothetical protein
MDPESIKMEYVEFLRLFEKEGVDSIRLHSIHNAITLGRHLGADLGRIRSFFFGISWTASLAFVLIPSLIFWSLLEGKIYRCEEFWRNSHATERLWLKSGSGFLFYQVAHGPRGKLMLLMRILADSNRLKWEWLHLRTLPKFVFRLTWNLLRTQSCPRLISSFAMNLILFAPHWLV